MKFYRDVLGFPLKFQSPGWSEFSTGETSLGLHPASKKNPAGSIQFGFGVADLRKFHQEMSAKGIQFTMPPTKQDFGGVLAQFVDSGRSLLRRRRATVLAATFPITGVTGTLSQLEVLGSIYFGITSLATLLATTSRISARFLAASSIASRDP